MKLVEILARELGEWPDSEGVSCIVQDPDNKLYAKYRDDDDNPYFEGGEWMSVWHEKQVSFLIMPLATDHSTAIVTREMWQAERERLARDHASKKGGSGSFKTKVPMGWIGGYNMAINVRLGDTPIEDFDGGVHISDPRHNRDRIRAIDADFKIMAAERERLVSELAAEGFALIDKPVEDMSDWRNWKVGDMVIRVVMSDESEMPAGVPMEITRTDESNCGQNIKVDGRYWPKNSSLKFHSRP